MEAARRQRSHRSRAAADRIEEEISDHRRSKGGEEGDERLHHQPSHRGGASGAKDGELSFLSSGRGGAIHGQRRWLAWVAGGEEWASRKESGCRRLHPHARAGGFP